MAETQFQKQRPDDVVQTRAEASARHDARAHILRIEEQPLARAGELEQKLRFRRRTGIEDETGRHSGAIAHSAPLW
jgi:hypothetical protein